MMPPINSVQPTSVPQNMPWREADAVEQRGVSGKAHAAEGSEQFLHPMRNEDAAERDPQDRFGILVHGAVDVTERGNVVV
jgi:hypothetical protein